MRESFYIAKQIMDRLGYRGGVKALSDNGLKIEADMRKLTTKDNKQELEYFKKQGIIGLRTGSVIVLTESGLWRLIVNSKKFVLNFLGIL